MMKLSPGVMRGILFLFGMAILTIGLGGTFKGTGGSFEDWTGSGLVFGPACILGGLFVAWMALSKQITRSLHRFRRSGRNRR